MYVKRLLKTMSQVFKNESPKMPYTLSLNTSIFQYGTLKLNKINFRKFSTNLIWPTILVGKYLEGVKKLFEMLNMYGFSKIRNIELTEFIVEIHILYLQRESNSVVKHRVFQKFNLSFRTA